MRKRRNAIKSFAELEQQLQAICKQYPELADDYDSRADIEGSFNEAYKAIKERVAAGGEPWKPNTGETKQ